MEFVRQKEDYAFTAVTVPAVLLHRQGERELKLHPTLQLVSEALTICNWPRLLGTIYKAVRDVL